MIIKHDQFCDAYSENIKNIGNLILNIEMYF